MIQMELIANRSVSSWEVYFFVCAIIPPAVSADLLAEITESLLSGSYLLVHIV